MSLLPLGLLSSNYSVKHYDIQLDIHPKPAKFSANVHMTLLPEKSTTSVSFYLHRQCTVTAVNYLGLPLTFKRGRSRQQNLQSIGAKLPRRIRKGEKLVLNIIYTGSLHNCTKDVVQLAPEDFWFPFVPGQQYTSQLKITLPEQTKVVASGKLTGEKPVNTRFQTTWVGKTPTRGLHILAGKLNRSEQQGLSVYYPRPLLNQARLVNKYGPSINQLLDQLLGRCSVAQSYVALTEDDVASCSSSYIITFGPDQLEKSRNLDCPRQRTLTLFTDLARELARKRLRCRMSTTAPANTWYLEGLATYCSWLAVEQEYGLGQKEQMLLEARQQILEAPPAALASLGGGFGCRFPTSALAKAAWVMHMVHNLAGDSFFPAVRECLDEQQGSVPSPKEFFLEVGKRTGTDLAAFYREWVETAPRLELVLKEPRTFLDDDGQWQLLFCLVNQGKLKWPLPVDVHLTLDDGTVEHHSICVREEPYLFSTPAKVVRAQVDKDYRLLNWAPKNSYNL